MNNIIENQYRITLICHQDSHERIDKYLFEQDIEELYSRSFIERLVKDNLVRVDGVPVKKSHILKKGQTIDIYIPVSEKNVLIAQAIPLDIVYEDEEILIINKAPGITVHPAPGNWDNTIVNALLYYLQDNISTLHENRPGIVHRLDKDTTGLMIVAKNNSIHMKLQEMFAQRQIKKQYFAILSGEIKSDRGTIDSPIDRNRKDRKTMAVYEHGKQAITHYQVMRRYNYFTLVDIILETGRTHQIRVHFKSIGNPVLGDTIYNSYKTTISNLPLFLHKKVRLLLDNHLHRQALHAYKLEFIHPTTNQLLTVESRIPEDLQNTIKWLDNNFSKEEDSNEWC
ncbi:MAG: RluA family pseudouridine synthase [Candidatus Cloacimonetes bacterium]|nr:RluA family pseudouridine synthase [Candidatus Cloacimonadota bacterium]